MEHESAYLRDPWNVFDAVLIVFIWVRACACAPPWPASMHWAGHSVATPGLVPAASRSTWQRVCSLTTGGDLGPRVQLVLLVTKVGFDVPAQTSFMRCAGLVWAFWPHAAHFEDNTR